jgi:hypothetical protein
MKLIKYAILPIFKADGAYSYHWAWNGQIKKNKKSHKKLTDPFMSQKEKKKWLFNQ